MGVLRQRASSTLCMLRSLAAGPPRPNRPTSAGCPFPGAHPAHRQAHVWLAPPAGGVVGTINNYANLLQVSNAIAIWLGISPPDLFFYAVSVTRRYIMLRICICVDFDRVHQLGSSWSAALLMAAGH